MKKISVGQRGFSVIEVILAAALFVVLSAGAVTVVLQALDANRLGEEQTVANQYAAEGIEAARSIKNQAFANLVNSAGTGIVRSGSVWAFSGSNNVLSSKYTRVLTVSDVQRDGSGNIVASGGTLDSLTKKIISTVSWNFTPTRSNSVVLTSYLSNWKKAIVGDWSNPSQDGSLDLAGAQNGNKVQTQGNYAYIVRNGGVPEFVIVDITNPASPVLAGSLTLSGSPRNIAVSGNYAYVASNYTSQELQIIDVSNPAAPTLAGSYDAPGSSDMVGVYVVGTTVYLGRVASAQAEFYIVNAANPAAPALVGSLELGASSDANEVYVSGSFAYVASGNNSQELQVINISTPATPTLAASLDLSGTQDGSTITGFGNTVVVGRLGSGGVAIINISTPTAPTLVSTFAVGGAVRDVDLGNSNNYLFVASDVNTAEFQVVNIATLASPTLLGSVNMPADLNGVAYSSSLDRACTVSDYNTGEFILLKPQ